MQQALQRPTASGDHPEAFPGPLQQGTPTVQLQPVQLQQPMPLPQQALPVPLQPAMPQQAMMQELEDFYVDTEYYAGQEYYPADLDWSSQFAPGN